MNATPRPLPARVRDVFLAPSRLFAGFRDHAPWMDALALSTLVAMAAAAALPAEFFLEQLEDPVTRTGKPVEITSGPEEIVRWGRVLAMFSALAGHPLIALGLAGLLTLLFSVLGGGRVPFRQYLGVASHALLISALGTLVFLVVTRVGGAAEGGLVAWISGTQPDSFLLRVLDGLDPFQIWMLIVLALGVGTLDEKRSAGSAALVLLGLYLLLDLVTAALVV